jgi:hypothetical protein
MTGEFWVFAFGKNGFATDCTDYTEKIPAEIGDLKNSFLQHLRANLLPKAKHSV